MKKTSLLSLFSFHFYSLCEGRKAHSSRWAKFKGQTINDMVENEMGIS
jgi:hypothetical protein